MKDLCTGVGQWAKSFPLRWTLGVTSLTKNVRTRPTCCLLWLKIDKHGDNAKAPCMHALVVRAPEWMKACVCTAIDCHRRQSRRRRFFTDAAAAKKIDRRAAAGQNNLARTAERMLSAQNSSCNDYTTMDATDKCVINSSLQVTIRKFLSPPARPTHKESDAGLTRALCT